MCMKLQTIMVLHVFLLNKQAGRQATFAMYLVQAAARLFGLTILHCQLSSSSHDLIMSQAKSISKTQWIS